MIANTWVKIVTNIKSAAVKTFGAVLIFGYAANTANASEFPAYAGAQISFQQVFNSPNDADLKLNYARQQASKGDFISAAGILEGMLFTQPNWDSARLFYAVVLYNLDDPVAARRELALLQYRPLTADQRLLANQYTQKLNSNSATSTPSAISVTGRAEIGIRSDSNSSNTLFENTVIAPNDGDIAGFVNAAAAISKPTMNDRLNLHASLRGQTLRRSEFSRSDYDVLGASLGVSGDVSGMTIKAAFKADNVYISGDKYLTQMGPQLSISRKISDATQIKLIGTYVYQDFENTGFSVTERFRSGGKYAARATIKHSPSETLSLNAYAGYESKIATTQFVRYKGINFGAGVRKNFTNGIYAKAGGSLRLVDYGGPNRFVFPAIIREDTRFYTSASLGASVNKIGAMMGMEPKPGLDNLSVEGGVHFDSLSSNIDVFEYDNFGASVKLVWNF